MEIDFEALVAAAQAVSRQAYVKYSSFPVGAAVLTAEGDIVAGCNVENASYGLTMCAERVAVFRAVAQGARHLAAVAVYTPTDEPTAPCGACRQVLAEFADDMPVYLACDGDSSVLTTLAELLPYRFDL